MATHWSTQSRYPAHRAFVVHLAQLVPEDEPVPLGRAEHLLSGQSTHFSSWTELAAFMEQILRQKEEQPP